MCVKKIKIHGEISYQGKYVSIFSSARGIFPFLFSLAKQIHTGRVSSALYSLLSQFYILFKRESLNVSPCESSEIWKSTRNTHSSVFFAAAVREHIHSTSALERGVNERWKFWEWVWASTFYFSLKSKSVWALWDLMHTDGIVLRAENENLRVVWFTSTACDVQLGVRGDGWMSRALRIQSSHSLFVTSIFSSKTSPLTGRMKAGDRTTHRRRPNPPEYRMTAAIFHPEI